MSHSENDSNKEKDGQQAVYLYPKNRKKFHLLVIA